MKLLSSCICLFSLFLLFSCSEDDTVQEGAGPIVTRTLELPAIRGLDIDDAITVSISQGTTQTVTVEGQENLIDILSTEVNDGVWDVSFTQSTRRNEEFKVAVTLTDLDILDLAGASSATSDTDLSLDELVLDASGASSISLSGTVEQQIIDVSGASQVSIFDLISQETTVGASGASTVSVTATNRLSATASGASTIRYRGNPTSLAQDASGASQIVPE